MSNGWRRCGILLHNGMEAHLQQRTHATPGLHSGPGRAASEVTWVEHGDSGDRSAMSYAIRAPDAQHHAHHAPPKTWAHKEALEEGEVPAHPPWAEPATARSSHFLRGAPQRHP